MTPEEWRHIKTVFQRALELSSADRTALLAAQSNTVRCEVESLLRAYEHNNAFRETSSSDAPATVPSDQELIGRRFGPYRVLSLLGEGGMGSVWLAERTDGMFTRQIALKLVHPALMGRVMTERAAREREILASSIIPTLRSCLMRDFPMTASRTSPSSTCAGHRSPSTAISAGWRCASGCSSSGRS
jgi:eukaryotic-like serine/threonine-protein kinase